MGYKVFSMRKLKFFFDNAILFAWRLGPLDAGASADPALDIFL